MAWRFSSLRSSNRIDFRDVRFYLKEKKIRKTQKVKSAVMFYASCLHKLFLKGTFYKAIRERIL